MLDQITKYSPLVPTIAVIVYILGYVSFTSFLQSFGISMMTGLEFSIIRHGILLIMIIGPVVILSFSDFVVGNYDRAHPDTDLSVITVLNDALGYTILYSYTLVCVFFKIYFDTATQIMAGFLIICTLLNKIPIKPEVLKFLKGLYILVPMMVLTPIALVEGASTTMFFYLLQICVFTSCASLRIFNKSGNTFQASRIGTIVTAALFSATFFGGFIIISIPEKYGGDLRKTSKYHLTDSASETLKKTSLKSKIDSLDNIIATKIYETDAKYWFQAGAGHTVAIPKDFICCVSSPKNSTI